jgi:hypothetical protein
MKKVFLSYSSSSCDRAVIEGFRKALTEHNYSIVSLDVTPGRPIMQTLIEGVKTSDIVLAIATTNSANVFYELGLAMGSGKPLAVIYTEDVHLGLDLSEVPSIKVTGLSDLAEVRTRDQVLEFLERMPLGAHTVTPRPPTFVGELETIYSNPPYFESMTEHHLLLCISHWFQAQGAKVVFPARDEGIDMIVKGYKDSPVLFLEVKKRSPNSRISLADICHFDSYVSASKADRGIFISTCEPTQAAKAFLERTGSNEPVSDAGRKVIEFWNIRKLIDTMRTSEENDKGRS